MKANAPNLTWAITTRGNGYTATAKALRTTQGHLSNLAAGRRGASPDLIVALAGHLDMPITIFVRNLDYPDADLLAYLIEIEHTTHLVDLVGPDRTADMLGAKASA